jgi:hypothetical protein
MRGDETEQGPMFSYVSPAQRVPSDHPLRRIREMSDVALKSLSREFDRLYSKVGRPSIAPRCTGTMSIRGDEDNIIPWETSRRCSFRWKLQEGED